MLNNMEEELKHYYELLVSNVSSSNYFKSRIKSIRRELIDYMHSQSYRETFERIWERNFGLESLVKTPVPDVIPLVQKNDIKTAVA